MLNVKFPQDQWPGWEISELVLKPVDPTKDISMTVFVDSNHPDYGSDSPLFMAESPCDQSVSPSTTTRLALKFAFRGDFLSSLEFEAHVYNVLFELQGTTVPRCYGLFYADRDGDRIGCLALERWGSGLEQSFATLPITQRLDVLRQLSLIHRMGVLHGDVAERNVLVADNEVRIIDFDEAKQHNCECDFSAIIPGSHAPKKETFNCDELYECCETMEIWRGSESTRLDGLVPTHV